MSTQDVLLDVAPNLTLYRVNGVWKWKPSERPLISVLEELEGSAHHMLLRGSLMEEAIHQLKQRGSPP
jgi:hypothetical protein